MFKIEHRPHGTRMLRLLVFFRAGFHPIFKGNELMVSELKRRFVCVVCGERSFVFRVASLNARFDSFSALKRTTFHEYAIRFFVME